jgi:predicted adenine nucleotide alpha hydrolase (AANH) superfamily ATPase
MGRLEHGRETPMKPRLLLHACCGVCSAVVPERLMPDFDVTVYYENSNIYPSREFVLRHDAAKTMADGFGLPFIQAPHEPESWFRSVRGLSQEPERGARCEKCIAFRLDRTFAYAKTQGFARVATTLSVSRRKDVDQINRIGRMLADAYGLGFLGRDWKKDSGEILSQQRAKKAGIYRQTYCGCVYSLVHSQKSKVESH